MGSAVRRMAGEDAPPVAQPDPPHKRLTIPNGLEPVFVFKQAYLGP